MRLIKYILAAVLLIITTSCYETLPDDGGRRFAADMATSTHNTVILPALTNISILHKASTWRDAAGDESTQHEIEDKYFSRITPRENGNKITILTPSDFEAIVEHNNISLADKGAKWIVSTPHGDTLTKRLSIENKDGNKWICTQEAENGEIVLTMNVEWKEVDDYIFSLDATGDIIYNNSPVVAQHIYNDSMLAAKIIEDTPYDIFTPLLIVDGSYVIEMKSSTTEVIEGDDVSLSFQSTPDFNPLITFRGESFKYHDIYNPYILE